MKQLILGMALSLFGMTAYAVPISFEFSGGSIETTGCLCLGNYSDNAGSAWLDDGESANFTFGTASVLGIGSGVLTATVDFLSPIANGESVDGHFSVASIGLLSGGKWTGGSVDFNYNTGLYMGTARLFFDAIDTGLQLGPHFKLTGSITNLGSVSVPEPTPLALLGLGLLGLAYRQRCRQ